MMKFPFAGKPDTNASTILRICEAERQRQWRTLIMIPSESICHPEAVAVLTSDLGNIYAEGLPQPILCHTPRNVAADERMFHAWETRLSDRRFYKGTVNANRAELLTHLRIAEAFASLEGSPDECAIHVNVQALSGAAANLAVFEALLEPGDRFMGLDLSHGGHLTHGSEFNFSGKTYKVASYGVNMTTRKLDYEQIRRRALEFKPKILIGGASAYPWDFDWAVLRRIADEAGAYLLADIAHLAGLVVGGVANNPLPHAHVVTFTTHKTLCGPRGAVILTTDPELGRKIDMAVFPGMQGGPHMNSIAAIGRLFELILSDREGFRRFQRDTVSNARFFARCLADEGFELEYGGTNTHMLLVNLKPFHVEGETFLDGEIAARLLEIAGIVCNKNVIPGDVNASQSSGLRFGLPWLTQRGVTQAQLREIAKIVRFVLEHVHTMNVWAPTGEEKCRGRVGPGVLEEAARQTLAIVEDMHYPAKPSLPCSQPVQSKIGDRVALLVRGGKVRLALDQMLTARLPATGVPIHAQMLDSDGTKIDDVIAMELERSGEEQRWLLLPHEKCALTVRHWIEELSDGYLLFDKADLQQKIDGPSVVEEIAARLLPSNLLKFAESGLHEIAVDITKPYFIGQQTLYKKVNPSSNGMQAYNYTPEEQPLRKTVLNTVHHQLGAKMAPFGGWEMPIQYPGGILSEHRAVRTGAGLFDVSHMGALEISGPYALAFLETLLANCVSRLAPGEAQYSYLLYPNGTAVDDLYVYRLDRERFMLVVNAANADRVKHWIAAVNSRHVIIDEKMPVKKVGDLVTFRDLRNAGEDSLIGLALQGPASLTVLEKLTEKSFDRATLAHLIPNTFTNVKTAGVPVLVARTGYTGERLGFEIYMHPEKAEKLWGALLNGGKPFGVLPAGLGARDSTRVEAGFPLFGHELEGELGLSITEANYGFVARFHVPFFIGREAYITRTRRSQRRLLRLHGQGRKSLRSGHVILDNSRNVVGQVTSFAYVHEDMTFIVLACVEGRFNPKPGEVVTGVRATADKCSGETDERNVVMLTTLPRFPDAAERTTWIARYGGGRS